MFETPITIVGNIMDEVALKTSPTGVARLSFRVASTQRRTDRETGEWTDGERLILNVTFWREFAENVAKSVRKGDPVVVHGTVHTREWIVEETRRSSYEMVGRAIGPDLKQGTAKFEKRRKSLSGSIHLDADGLPEQFDDEGYELVGDAPSGDSDANSGEAAASAERVLATAMAG
jgi:single-strand DNA-binding protein